MKCNISKINNDFDSMRVLYHKSLVATSQTIILEMDDIAANVFSETVPILEQETTLSWVNRLIYRLLIVVFGRVPLFIYRMLSYTMTATITLDFWRLTAILTVFTLVGGYLYRLRIDHLYKKLGSTSEVPKNAFDLKPDSFQDDHQSQPYADEFLNAFLSSIKVFGYLDKPVLKELVRTLGTKKLAEGEVLFDFNSKDRDFYVVVEGEIEIFIQSSDIPSKEAHSDAGLHLLNKVRSAGSVTSLFSILSILSDDIEIPSPLCKIASEGGKSTGNRTPMLNRRPDIFSPKAGDEACSADEISSTTNTETSISNKKGLSNIPADNDTVTAASDETVIRASVATIEKVQLPAPLKIKTKVETPPKNATPSRSVHPNLLARASTYTTLAVIPASAFRRLSVKYPKATAHMVQVILTRFQRVTFQTLHRYLGLSHELLSIEQNVNDVSGGGLLPPELFGNDMIYKTLWRISKLHESTTLDSSFSRGTELFEDLTDAREFNAGGDDEILKDSVFASISQLIGMTPSKELSETTEDDVSSVADSRSGSIPLERLYQSTRKSSTASVSTSGAIRNLVDQDILSVSSFSSGHHSEGEDRPDIDIQYFKQGETILHEGDRIDGLYFVLDGVIEALTETCAFKTEMGKRTLKNNTVLYLIKPGGIAGYLPALTGNASFVTLRAKTDLLVGLMPKIILDRYIDKYPNVLMLLAKRLVNQLSPLVFHIDVALEWGQINAGHSLCHQGDKADSIFIVLTGRLRSIKEHANSVDGNSIVIEGEHGPSESVGEMEVLIEAPRPATIHVLFFNGRLFETPKWP